VPCDPGSLGSHVVLPHAHDQGCGFGGHPLIIRFAIRCRPARLRDGVQQVAAASRTPAGKGPSSHFTPPYPVPPHHRSSTDDSRIPRHDEAEAESLIRLLRGLRWRLARPAHVLTLTTRLATSKPPHYHHYHHYHLTYKPLSLYICPLGVLGCSSRRSRRRPTHK